MSRLARLRRRWEHRAPGEIVIVDNRDSFVFNLAHRLAQAGMRPVVVRSDEVCAQQIFAMHPAGVVLSPGPGHPRDAGCSVEVVQRAPASLPVLGVCLGHQAIAQAYGGEVSPSHAPRHGMSSWVEHDGQGVFEGLADPMEVGRYHSLVVHEPLPHGLEVTARCDGLIMGLRHTQRPLIGVQFHPESVLSPHGLQLLANFARMCSQDPC